jgi:hypothetical protein
MRELSRIETEHVAGGDRWGDTPEGRSTPDGGSGGQTGPLPICKDAGFSVAGKPIEVCIITRTN